MKSGDKASSAWEWAGRTVLAVTILVGLNAAWPFVAPGYRLWFRFQGEMLLGPFLPGHRLQFRPLPNPPEGEITDTLISVERADGSAWAGTSCFSASTGYWPTQVFVAVALAFLRRNRRWMPSFLVGCILVSLFVGFRSYIVLLKAFSAHVPRCGYEHGGLWTSPSWPRMLQKLDQIVFLESTSWILVPTLIAVCVFFRRGRILVAGWQPADPTRAARSTRTT